ncbi:hypothetical protein SO802_015296 [Lithocarpus litseifolius]|uniref:MULE transposase domain-containing protein n=1 Tax=Lithocarpus litseifolius TaxID=425828 RepID=A0AAW2CT99_9ROSI
MQQDLLKNFGVQVSQKRLYRAKRKAREEDYGNHARSYKKIPTYANVVLETNPGSIAKIQYERPNIAMNPILKRFFLCFDAMKKGFINGCRPFLGIDGCHLKGPFGGVLLAAITLDGNNGLFPIAIAIVEVECRDSLLFFLHHLDAALVSMTDKPLCIMSDHQKGLTDAVAQVFPRASHRLCCRHIYSNFKVKFPGLMLKINFWAAAKAYNEFLFNNAMQRIRVNNKAAYDWLMTTCILHRRANVETYCDEYLTRFTYLKAYGEIIHPLPDLNDINADEEVEPPILHRLPSRARKNRRKEPGEQPIGLNVARRKQGLTRESSGVRACANVMNNAIENVVEDGLDATTQQSVNGATTGMNEFTPLANDEPSGSEYAAF